MIKSKVIRYTPFRASKGRHVYPDHYAFQVVFKNIPTVQKDQSNNDKVTQWNLNKEGGWEKYFNLTDRNKKLDVVFEESEPDVIQDKISKETKKIKFRSFGKVQPRRKEKVPPELEKN